MKIKLPAGPASGSVHAGDVDSSRMHAEMIRTALAAIVVLALLSTGGMAGTSLTVEGQVVDRSTGEPIIGATIMVDGTAIGGVSDSTGYFRILFDAGDRYRLKVTAVGYRGEVSPRYAADGPLEPLTIRLSPASVPVGDITVTSSRFSEEVFSTSQGVSVTSSEEFAGRSFSSTADMLREEPGILVQKTTHGHGAPIIRGLIGRYVLLLYDGIRLNKPTFRFGANQYLNTVDLESLDRIEVVRGPSSVMYGSDAIGGAVNLIPGMQLFGTGEISFSPSATTRYSSADNGKSAHADFTVGSRRLTGAFGATYKDIDDVRAGGDIGKQTPTGWTEHGFSGRVAYHFNHDSRVTFDYLAVRQSEVPRYDKYVTGDFEQYVYDPQDRDLVGLSFASEGEGRLVESVKANVSYQREAEGKTTQKTGMSSVSISEDKLSTWGAYVQASSKRSRGHRLNIGGEFYVDEVTARAEEITDGTATAERPEYPDGSKYTQVGVFAQDDWSPVDPIRLTLGVRYSRVRMESLLEEPFGEFDESYDDVTGALSLSYMPVEAVNLIGRWSRGFRAPSLNDAVVLKYSSSGVDAPSVDLSPEYSNNLEVGLKVRSSELTGSLFLFFNRLENMIDRRPGTYNGLTFFDENGNGLQDDDEYDIYQRYNVGRSRIYGVEYSGDWRPYERWQFRSNLFWTRGENLTADEPMSRIPPVMGLVGARYLPDEAYWLEVYVRAAGAQRRLSARDIDDTRIADGGTPGWVTLNLRGQYRVGQASVTVALENVTDKTYKEHGSGVYSPGRNLVVTLGYGGR